MLERLTINLSENERQALEKSAEIEIRDPRDQARFILRRELARLGFLQPTAESTDQTKTKELAPA